MSQTKQEGQMRAPVQATGKPRNFSQTFLRLMSYFAPQKLRLVLALIAASISTASMIAGPKITGLAITSLFDGLLAEYQAYEHHLPIPSIDFHYIATILLSLLGMQVVSAACMFVQQYIMAGVAQDAVYQLRREAEEKLSRLPLKYFDERTHGEILSHVVNDIDNISTMLQQGVTQLMTSIVTVIGIIVMMLLINPLLCLLVTLTIPLSLLVTREMAKRSQQYFRNQQRALGDLNGLVEEMYTGHKVIKAFGHEKLAIARFMELNEKLYEAGWKAQFVSGMIMPLVRFIGKLSYVIVAVAGSILVTNGAVSIGDIQAFFQYTQMLTMSITQLANLTNIIQLAMASGERIFALLGEEEQIPDSVSIPMIAESQSAVRFEHVCFGYREETLLIEDLNIDVRPGQMIAIVGPTGTGKTTLVNLLMRFYEVKYGRILVNGVDVTQLRRSDLRHMFGMVLQDTWLFNGTIRDNIAYGREHVAEEAIIQAAKMANADHFIRTLPDGYDTILNEETTNLSQGQKQLLTIARAFLADPEILILDEATSSVDTRTEMQIQSAMARLMKGRTGFVIAHRLSTIRDADQILVMNHGSIIEQGTHSELLARNGFYTGLHKSQFAGQSLVKEIV